MADISKCAGQLGNVVCSVRENCWRFVAPAGERQAWMVPESFGEDCPDYWRMRREPKKAGGDGAGM